MDTHTTAGPAPADHRLDVVVIGGGQAGLAVAYYLRRAGLTFTVLDAEAGPGGAWRHGWPSLRLFSPAEASSLPGWPMPMALPAPPDGGFPRRDDVLAYLAAYEQRYALPVERPVRVRAVRRTGDAAFQLRVEATRDGAPEQWEARAVVSATGTWATPFVPDVPGRADFAGRQLHSAHYVGPDAFAGQRVLVVGGGNSGAQVVADLALAPRPARATWVTLTPPRFLPDDVDGRVLFDHASALHRARAEGRAPEAPLSLGDVVVVPPVRAARDAGLLTAVRPFVRMTPRGVVWPDGREEAVDAVVWCTGFRPALAHLEPLGVAEPDGRVATEGTRAVREPRLWCVGYGSWTGFASATLIGVGRTAKATAAEIAAALHPVPTALVT